MISLPSLAHTDESQRPSTCRLPGGRPGKQPTCAEIDPIDASPAWLFERAGLYTVTGMLNSNMVASLSETALTVPLCARAISDAM